MKKITGINDAEFVHASGFVSFWLLKESAIKATELSINNTQLFNRFPEKKSETSLIEEKLYQHIYKFPFLHNNSGNFF